MVIIFIIGVLLMQYLIIDAEEITEKEGWCFVLAPLITGFLSTIINYDSIYIKVAIVILIIETIIALIYKNGNF